MQYNREELLSLSIEDLNILFVGKTVQITLVTNEVMTAVVNKIICSPYCVRNNQETVLPTGFILSNGREPDFAHIARIVC